MYYFVLWVANYQTLRINALTDSWFAHVVLFWLSRSPRTWMIYWTLFGMPPMTTTLWKLPTNKTFWLPSLTKWVLISAMSRIACLLFLTLHWLYLVKIPSWMTGTTSQIHSNIFLRMKTRHLSVTLTISCWTHQKLIKVKF